MEAICRPWEEPWVFGGDPLEFAGSVAEEFLSKEEDGSSARGCREKKGEGCDDVYGMAPLQETRFWIDKMQQHEALLRQPFEEMIMIER